MKCFINQIGYVSILTCSAVVDKGGRHLEAKNDLVGVVKQFDCLIDAKKKELRCYLDSGISSRDWLYTINDGKLLGLELSRAIVMNELGLKPEDSID